MCSEVSWRRRRSVVTEVFSKQLAFNCGLADAVRGETLFSKASTWALSSVCRCVRRRANLDRRQQEERPVSPESSSQVNNSKQQANSWLLAATSLKGVSGTVQLNILYLIMVQIVSFYELPRAPSSVFTML